MTTQQQKAYLDPFTTVAQSNNDLSVDSKVETLGKILKAARFCMMTTLSTDGSELHSRCMYPASTENLQFQFVANKVSYKFEELNKNNLIHLSFLDSNSTSWASITGHATVTNDPELVKKLWSPTLSGYFADLQDGVHNSTPSDPRISIITVKTQSVRYWYSTQGAVSHALDTARAAVTGKLTVPGELYTLSSQEIQKVCASNKPYSAM
ncbi:SubName: Full=Related to BLI-3 blue-light-inducible Bli-3 protein {ECO:0000313/EMBL:CCA68312.1} [Serendipita indica DSM 11827]|uniref:Related to BLI-3 blue-light-inducible Bli-3 protein n=1 Tax=Serendipita indica (strain DSM 11827) TaxID=1109443 RepID=G4TAG3_SERID|nr:SubName: Full=Related to BLI-3 blue-light-inducible Bli-3 protein {ECO:0000313/EMBL:CCA68312.1} [Serendipita indica DSM 11827]CCA68312.1 related to BLI-3 blue-light-inducible Bli-3 protein [Serendipita indica DSM 11827]